MERRNEQSALHAREQQLQGLLIRGLDGDAVAYRAFLKALADHLRGFLRRRLASRLGEVEDLVQEVLLAVHNARASYRAEQPATAWVYAIARYKLADYFRMFARHEGLHDPIDDEAAIFAYEDREQAEAVRDVEKLLATLPDKQRLPIMYVKLEGHSVAEAAKMTGLSESAVKVGVHRGLKALAARIRGTS